MVEIIPGMWVIGYSVRCNDPQITYGLFPTVVAAQQWAELMTSPTVIEPVYAAVSNRG